MQGQAQGQAKAQSDSNTNANTNSNANMISNRTNLALAAAVAELQTGGEGRGEGEADFSGNWRTSKVDKARPEDIDKSTIVGTTTTTIGSIGVSAGGDSASASLGGAVSGGAASTSRSRSSVEIERVSGVSVPMGTAIKPVSADLSGMSLDEIKTLTGHY